MLAAVHRDSFSLDSLSACLRRENPNRLVSLWDIVNQFDCAQLNVLIVRILHLQEIYEGESNKSIVERISQRWPNPSDLPEDVKTTLEQYRSVENDQYWAAHDLIEHLSTFCESAGFRDALRTIGLAKAYLHGRPSFPELRIEIRHLGDALFLELTKRTFLRVDQDRRKYVDEDELFGAPVHSAFPSARPDIKQAGNCLAAGNDTAAVFHLMRAVEWALRALCVHMGFQRLRSKNKKTGKVSYTPLGWTDWETILNQLKSRVTERIGKTKRGPKKQLFQEFYYPALQDIEGIKDAWRNHVMHTRREYTRDDADAVLDHVKRLMVNLATRVSER